MKSTHPNIVTTSTAALLAVIFLFVTACDNPNQPQIIQTNITQRVDVVENHWVTNTVWLTNIHVASDASMRISLSLPLVLNTNGLYGLHRIWDPRIKPPMTYFAYLALSVPSGPGIIVTMPSSIAQNMAILFGNGYMDLQLPTFQGYQGTFNLILSSPSREVL